MEKDKMKKLLLILLCLPMIGFGQQTYVPDDAFEAYIETTFLNADNGVVNDNYVLTSGLDGNNNSALAIYGITLTSLPITDLTGIE